MPFNIFGFSTTWLRERICWLCQYDYIHNPFDIYFFCLKLITDREIQNYKKLIHYAESVVCKLSLHHRDKTSTLIGPNKKFTPLYIY